MKKTTFFLCTFFLLLNCSAQNPLVKQWDKRFGGSVSDALYSMQQTADHGYILGGSSNSPQSGDKSQPNWDPFGITSDYWVVKIDSMGTKQWDKRFGGIQNDQLRSLQQTSDGGYIIGGFSFSDSSGDKTQHSQGSWDYWIVKIDSNGNKQWDKRYGGSDTDDLYSLQQTTDGGYILGGSSLSGLSGDKTQLSWGGHDYWVVKIDSIGNKLWDRRFGGNNTDYFNMLKQCFDGGYILGGATVSIPGGDVTQPSLGALDIWIIKIDSLGNKEWDRRFGGSNGDNLVSLAQTTDNSYILGGASMSGISGDKTQPNWDPSNSTADYWILKIDSVGNKIFDKRYGGNDDETTLYKISQTSDEGYLLSGKSFSNASGNKTENNYSNSQTWIVKIDSVGNVQWDKTLHTSLGTGDGSGIAIETNAGCYAIANYTPAGVGGDKSQPSQGNNDFWIITYRDTTSLISPAVFSADDSSYCEEHCFNFTDLSTNSPTSWAWGFPGALPDTSNDQNPQQICYSTPGSYTVTLVASNGTNSNTAVYPNFITIYGTPSTPYITVSGPNGDTLTSSPALFYQWNVNGQPISGATSQIYVAPWGGSYTVTTTDANNCSATSFPIQITGITTIFSNIFLNINPNPAVDHLEIDFNLSEQENISFNVNNPLGQYILSFEKKINNGTSHEILDLNKLDDGIYFLTLKSKNGNITSKFIKSSDK